MVAQVVAHRTTNQEVPSLIPTGNWAFLFSSLSYLSQSVVHPRTGPSWRCIPTDYQLYNKNESLAEQLKAKQLKLHGMTNKFGTIVALGLFNKAFGAYSFPKILVDEEKYIKLDSWSKD